MIRLVDSHCHLDRLDLSKHNNQLALALDAAKKRNVEHFLCVCIDQDNFDHVYDIATEYPMIDASVGVHPLNENICLTNLSEWLMEKAQLPNVVAIGETGLDFYYAKKTAKLQQASFEIHVDIAKQMDLPLIIHTRMAKQETIDCLKHYTKESAGVMHCFTEDWDMAKQALDLGYYISISGIVTFKQADNVREVAKKIPSDRLLIETDSPYLAPVPNRGKPCEPAFVMDTAKFLAELRNESLEELANNTYENYFNLFKLSQKNHQPTH